MHPPQVYIHGINPSEGTFNDGDSLGKEEPSDREQVSISWYLWAHSDWSNDISAACLVGRPAWKHTSVMLLRRWRDAWEVAPFPLIYRTMSRIMVSAKVHWDNTHALSRCRRGGIIPAGPAHFQQASWLCYKSFQKYFSGKMVIMGVLVLISYCNSLLMITLNQINSIWPVYLGLEWAYDSYGKAQQCPVVRLNTSIYLYFNVIRQCFFVVVLFFKLGVE